MYIIWEFFEVFLGRIIRYDVFMNGKIIYLGIEFSYIVRRLILDIEYLFVVSDDLFGEFIMNFLIF